jgi:predicted DNA-binding WGR domain protein
MPQGTTYLELSEDTGSAHKFYEVTVTGSDVVIRYGRIGTPGTVQNSSFPTPQKAEAAADKKIAEKVRKGYASAVAGVRQARPVTRRAIVSHSSSASQAPVLWRFRTGASAFGIFVDEERCWAGNERGDVYTVSHTGEVTSHVRLPDSVKCIVADDFWLCSGCDDGKVYDLSGKIPRVAYEIASDVDIYWLDIHEGVLGVADRQGGITSIDHEDEFQWSRRSKGSHAWMVRCDESGVYHGHSSGVTMYDPESGDQRWHADTQGDVLFGWQERDAVYAGTSRNKVYRISKSGQIQGIYQCDGSVFSCATAPDGRYVFAGDNHSSVYCFDREGTRLWKLGTGCGSAYSMQYLNDRLYIVTTDGSLACIDASDAAIRAAQQGTVPEPVNVKAASTLETVVPTTQLEITADTGDGIVLECVDEGGRLRIRVVSPVFDRTWNVQFPKGLRQAGARYVVDGVHTARGGFYRPQGEIRRLR